MAKTQTATALVSSQTLTAGSTVRGRLDCTAVDGGLITLRITNGGTSPTTQCEGRILVAHKQTSMPAAASAGTGDSDWKTAWVFGGSTVSNASTPVVWPIGRAVAYVEVEFTGNTGQSVTVEAHATTYVDV